MSAVLRAFYPLLLSSQQPPISLIRQNEGKEEKKIKDRSNTESRSDRRKKTRPEYRQRRSAKLRKKYAQYFSFWRRRPANRHSILTKDVGGSQWNLRWTFAFYSSRMHIFRDSCHYIPLICCTDPTFDRCDTTINFCYVLCHIKQSSEKVWKTKTQQQVSFLCHLNGKVDGKMSTEFHSDTENMTGNFVI